MKHNLGNQKSAYTKKQISKALFVLLEKNEYPDITVSMLCESAGCSRPSFYRNFDKVDDVFSFAIRDKIDEFMENEDRKEGRQPATDQYIDKKILDLWLSDREFVTLVVRKGLLHNFIVIICEYMDALLRQTYFENRDNNQTDFSEKNAGHSEWEMKLAHYASSLQAYYTGGVLYAWANQGMTDSQEDVLRLLADIRKRQNSSRKSRN